MVTWNNEAYYPQRPGGPFLAQRDYPTVPRIPHNNFDTEKTIEDKVRNIPIFQGLNEQQLRGYIQDEIEYARTNTLGLKLDKGNAARNTSADTGPS